MPRNIDVAMAGSLIARSKLSISNSYTDGKALYLHGNKIAWFDTSSTLNFSMCGYGTLTTRSRLNAVLNDYLEHLHNYYQSYKDITHIGITQKDHEQNLRVSRKDKQDLLIPIDSSKEYVLVYLLKDLDLTQAKINAKNKKDKPKPKEKFDPKWVMPKGDSN